MNAHTDIHDLLHAMSVAERKHFRKFAQRHKHSQDTVMLRVFDALLGQEAYDAADLEAKFGKEAFFRQFPVVKHSLTAQVLRSLESFHYAATPMMELRSLLSQIEYVFERGLHDLAARLAAKGRRTACQYDLFAQELEFVRWQMRLEKRKLDQEGIEKLAVLWGREDELIQEIQRESQLRSLHDRLLLMFKRTGKGDAAVTESLRAEIAASPLLSIHAPDLPFSSRNVYHYCHVYLSQLVGDLGGVVRGLEAMVQDWDRRADFRKLFPERYLVTRSSYLSALLQSGDMARFEAAMKQGEGLLPTEGQVAPRAFAMSYSLELQYLLRSFRPPIHPHLEQDIREGLDRHGEKIEPGTRLSLMHNLAVYLFIENRPQESLRWVNAILNLRRERIRLDIRDFAHALQLILLFELGEMRVLEYRIAAVKRIGKGTALTGALVQAIAGILGRVLAADAGGQAAAFAHGLESLDGLRQAAGEGTLGWMEAAYWLRSKVEGRSVRAVALGS